MNKETKTTPYYLFSAALLVVLGAASVWMGGLNQDEGWYLYAANMVAEGKLPYRDFFYTQGPLMPFVYSVFTWVWQAWGLLGARILTLLIGVAGIVFAMALARRFVPEESRNAASAVVAMLLGINIYHLYYLAIPKTYALASVFVVAGFFLVKVATESRAAIAILGGIALAFAAGTRISLGAILPVVGLWLLVSRRWKELVWFCVGAFAALALAYGPFLADEGSRKGLMAAQAYHAARGGFDLTWVVGSLSRLVRWYLPVFVVFGLGGFRRGWVVMAAFLAVFAVQMLAPFPYEDYQVPIMALLAVFAAINFVTEKSSKGLLLTLGMCMACSFGSPLLEKWSTNGQDRFWSLKKDKYELAQLREVAREIEVLDPDGKDIFTQDLYLAIETGRKVPVGLEMGPFSMLTDEEWRKLIASAPSRIAAMSGYAFAVKPPKCDERPIEQQMEFWGLLKRNYEMVLKEDSFGQNSTPLLILKRK